MGDLLGGSGTICCVSCTGSGLCRRFVFEYLDSAAEGDEALELFEFKHLFLGEDKGKGTSKGSQRTITATAQQRMQQKKQQPSTMVENGRAGSGGKRGSRGRDGTSYVPPSPPKGFGKAK